MVLSVLVACQCIRTGESCGISVSRKTSASGRAPSRRTSPYSLWRRSRMSSMRHADSTGGSGGERSEVRRRGGISTCIGLRFSSASSRTDCHGIASSTRPTLVLRSALRINPVTEMGPSTVSTSKRCPYGRSISRSTSAPSSGRALILVFRPKRVVFVSPARIGRERLVRRIRTRSVLTTFTRTAPAGFSTRKTGSSTDSESLHQGSFSKSIGCSSSVSVPVTTMLFVTERTPCTA